MDRSRDWTASDRLELPGSGVVDYALYGRNDSQHVRIRCQCAGRYRRQYDVLVEYRSKSSQRAIKSGALLQVPSTTSISMPPASRVFIPALTDRLWFPMPSSVIHSVRDRRTVEFSVASNAIGSTAALDVYVDVNNSVFLPTSYANFVYTVAASAPPPTSTTVGSVVLDGSLSEWTSADRIDTTLGVPGYEIYGRVTADQLCLCIKIGRRNRGQYDRVVEH